jgi:uncharacterized protein (TIGR00369 family)
MIERILGMDTMSAPLRQRTVAWTDPAATARAARGMAGIAFLQAVCDGALPPPPAIALLGIEVAMVEPGRVVMRLAPGEHLYNPMGSVHGGMIATLLDSVMACAVHSTLAQGRLSTTLEIKVSFVRALTEAAGVVSAEGWVVQVGRQVALAEARLTGGDGRLYATGSTTCLVFDAPADGPDTSATSQT